MSGDNTALVERSQNVQGSIVQPARPTSASRKRRASQKMDEKADIVDDHDFVPSTGKENSALLPRGNDNDDEITALPGKWRLDHSPHLRPVDSGRDDFRTSYDQHNATSQTSVAQTAAGSSKPGTLRSKRSTFDGGNSVKRRSSKKRKDDHMREEEIRAMSTSSPSKRRSQDGTPKRDSSKRRSLLGKKSSAAALPRAEQTPMSPASTVVEQNGFEVKEFWVNPRPPIRLSKVPAYTYESPSQTQLPLARDISQKVKDKMPAESRRRHRTIGPAADGLDSSDLRMVLERDARRKQERVRRRQDRLDRKTRAAGRRRSSSEISRLNDDVEKDKAFEAASAAAVLSSQRPGAPTASQAVHPALRDDPVTEKQDMVGLGIAAGAVATMDSQADDNENPFISPSEKQAETQATTGSAGYATPHEERQGDQGPFEDPVEDSVIGTAREVRLSIATTPPLSPVDRGRRSSARGPDEPLSPASPSMASAPQSPIPADTAAAAIPPVPKPRRASQRAGSQTQGERRSGAWASFFKRSGTQKESSKPAETSFANTSRESMGRQPLPPRLITNRESPFPQRRISGPPTRTQSKFREDLPDAPISPPESRIQSPVSEMPLDAAAIAAAAAAADAASNTAQSPTTAQQRSAAHAALSGAGRSDTPVSPIRTPDVMAGSLASVDSEASWLASGGSTKRASIQSGPARNSGSLKRHTADFNASYEDLSSGHDRDADYVQRTAQTQRLSGSALAGAEREDTDVDNAMPVHGSVRRKPTLVHRDPAVRSREGLLSEFSAAEEADSSALQDDSSSESELGHGARLEKARSVDYGKGHARQVSAGSAKLLDVTSKRLSSTPLNSPTAVAPTNMLKEEEE